MSSSSELQPQPAAFNQATALLLPVNGDAAYLAPVLLLLLLNADHTNTASIFLPSQPSSRLHFCINVADWEEQQREREREK